MKILLSFICFLLHSYFTYSQTAFGNNWIIGLSNLPDSTGTLLDFNNDPVHIKAVNKGMSFEGSIAVMSDSSGKFLFYSNGCYISDANHKIIFDGDSIGLGYLESSFCQTGGNPLLQGVIALPSPSNNDYYYLFYTDIQSPYENSGYFPLAPMNLYYSTIYAKAENITQVVTKHHSLISDTLARGMIQATRHSNGKDWWIIAPESHSNCYYTLRLTRNGIDSSFKQCLGIVWGDRDVSGQATFSPNSNKYCRFNYFNGLNIFDFNSNTGILSEPINIKFGLDTFYHCGLAISPNSQYLYAAAFDKLFQFDLYANTISDSKILISDLLTPSEVNTITRFNQAVLASDGKIYLGGTNGYEYLHLINKPNCAGTQCDFQQYAIKTPSVNFYGMPNIPNYQNVDNTVCDTVVNLSQVNNLKQFSLFPNPFIDKIYIEGITSFHLDIYDILGKHIYSIDSKHSSAEIDLSFFERGLYVYMISNKNIIIKTGVILRIN